MAASSPQTLHKRLIAVEKKLQEYEDLIATLYHNVCDRCKVDFQRIASKNLQAVLPPAEAIGPSKPGLGRILKRPLRGVSLPWSSAGRHGLISPRLGESPTVASRSLCSLPLSNLKVPPAFIPANGDPTRADWLVNYDDTVVPGALKVSLIHIWTHGAAVRCVKFSPDGKYLAAGLDVGKTCLYELKSMGQICVLEDLYAINKPRIWTLSFSPDGRYLATGRLDGQITVWDVGQKHVRNAFRGHRNHLTCIDFSPNGRLLASCSLDKTVRLWCMRSGSCIILDDDAYYDAVKFSPDGKHVAVSDADGIIKLWNVRERRLVEHWWGHSNAVLDLAFTPDGRGLISASVDKTLKYWDVCQPGHRRSRNDDVLEEVLEFVGHAHGIVSAGVSPDGQLVLSGSRDGSAIVWDMVDARRLCRLEGHQGSINSVDFSSENGYMGCGSEDGKFSVWRYETM